MVEKFHQLDQCQFCIVTIYVINLSSKCLSQTMAAEMFYFQSVPLFEFFEYYVDTLHGENRTFLTNKDRSCNAKRIDMLVTVFNMQLQFYVELALKQALDLNNVKMTMELYGKV